MTSLQDKTLFVTGGTSNIIRVTTVQAAHAGVKVSLVVRRETLTQELIDDLVGQ